MTSSLAGTPMSPGVVRLASLTRRRPAAANPGTPLDFDLNPDRPIDSPLLVLVPDQADRR